jgi:microcin C transport system substrate-binding protein
MHKFISRFLVLSSLCLLFPGYAESLRVPLDGWEPAPSPLASEWSEPGGRMRIFASQYPKSFNYYLDTNVFSSKLFGYQFESLIGRDGLTLEPEPGLAEKAEVSDDKLTFTFTLDADARWSDGQPVTADDVIWTFHAILNPEHLTGPHKVGLDRFEAPVKIDGRTVQFTAKEVHWNNLWSVGGMLILPSHWWKDQDFNKVNFEFPVVSGPYKIAKLNEPNSVILEKRADYWAANDPRGEGAINFDQIEFLFYPERDLAFDNFRAGNFDLFAVYTARRWASETDGEAFQKNWIVKQGIRNANPVGFQGFAMNMRRDNFKDARVRKALAHLLNRERMNATLMFNQYELTASYFPDLYPEANPNSLVAFDVDQARALLKEAGWEVNEKGQLAKDGKEFIINFLTRSADSDRFLLIYREALEQVGIQLKIDRKDWSAWAKDMDDYNFDMTWAAWGAGVFKDPESMWHSKYKDQASGNNITGFASEEVDAKIESIKGEFDVEKRHAVVKEIDAMLVAQTPYILLWHIDYVRLLYWNRFGTPDTVLTKYGDESSSEVYWWADPGLDADLKAAREGDKKLPPKPAMIKFAEIFEGATEPLR